jgi:hypothetical protein
VSDDPALIDLHIAGLQATYADIACRLAWQDLASIVMPEASFTFDLGDGQPVALMGPDELGAFGARATAGFAYYSYRVLTAVITSSDRARATGRVQSLEVGVDRSTGRWLEFYGLYDDAYLLDQDTWKFERRAFQVVATKT